MPVKPIGLTKSSKFQVGVRKALPVPYEDAWDFLWSKEAVNCWLGEVDIDKLYSKEPFKTANGEEGQLTTRRVNSHIRMKWKGKNWQNNSVVQIRLIQAASGTTFSFHQEHLLDELQRTGMKERWKGVLTDLYSISYSQ